MWKLVQWGVACAALLLVPSLAQASTLLFEDWEDPPSTIQARWADTSCLDGSGHSTFPLTSNPQLSTTRAFSGTHSLKYVFTGHQQSHIDAGFTGPGTLGFNLGGGCSANFYFTPTQEIWVTWLEWIDSGFQFDELVTKSWLIYGSRFFGDRYNDFVLDYNTGQAPSPATGQALGIVLQSVLDGNLGPPWGNAIYGGTVATVYNKWLCYENRLKMNDPGVANAAAELYVTNMTDGGSTVTSINQQNHQWRGTSLLDPWPSNDPWGALSVYLQDGIGTLYRDKITVSTTRIGCSGSPPPPDTTPPTQVTGFSVGAPTSSSLVVTATNGTDPDDTNLNLRLERCTGAGCSNFSLDQTIGAVGGSVTTRTDTGLAATTTYCYRANNQDAAGNLGPYSATACGTTSASVVTTRRTLGTDTFNRANGGLGASYTQSAGGNQIVSNAVEAVTLGAFGLDIRTDVLPNDQWISGVLGAFTGSSLSIGFINLHSGDPNPVTCLYERNNSSGSTSEIYVGSTQKAFNASAVWGPGDIPLCEVQGTNVTFSRNGVVILTADSTGSVSGKISLTMFALGALTDNTLDSISWGDYVAAAQPVIASATCDTTGCNLTSGATTPSFLRVQTTGTGGTNIVYTWNDGVVMTAGRYTQPGGGWAAGLTNVTFFAQDANHVESSLPGDHITVSLAGLTMNPDVTPPVLAPCGPSGTISTVQTTQTISCTSDEPADLKYNVTTDATYNAMTKSMTTVDGLHHSAQETVSNGNTYTFKVRGQDRSPNHNQDTSSVTITFTVSNADTTAPTPPGNVSAAVVSSSQATITIGTSSTDAVGVTGYQAVIGATSGGVCNPTLLVNPTWSTALTQQLVNLIGNTTYCLNVKGFDAAGNLSTASNTTTFTTPPLLDPIPPSNVTGCVSGTLTYNSITVTCTPATDNVAVFNYAWYRCTGATCTNFNVKFVTPGPTLSDTGQNGALLPQTTYRYIVFANDFSGNVSVNSSPILTITTPHVPDGTTFGLCPCKSH